MREFKEMCFIKHGCNYGSVAFELENSNEPSIGQIQKWRYHTHAKGFKGIGIEK